MRLPGYGNQSTPPRADAYTDTALLVTARRLRDQLVKVAEVGKPRHAPIALWGTVSCGCWKDVTDLLASPDVQALGPTEAKCLCEVPHAMGHERGCSFFKEPDHA